MKKTLLILQVLFFLQIQATSQKNSKSAKAIISKKTSAEISKKQVSVPRDDWETAAQKYIAESEYFFRPAEGLFVASNRKQRMAFKISGNRVTTYPLQTGGAANSGWTSSSMELTGITKNERPVQPGILPQGVAEKGRLVFDYRDYQIEYLNTAEGLRQNFIVNRKPEGNGRLQISLDITGDLKPYVSGKKELILADKKNGKKLLEYDDLKVWDANNRVLNAYMENSGDDGLVITVEDEAAVYPVTVDPLTHSSEWSTSAAGVLPGLLTNLQLQVDAIYGYSVAGLGDVNGDGYDDIAIGAPGAIDVIAGPVTVVGAGAVFVYFGSASGPPVVPDKILRATTPVTNALFGFSIAGGNVTGDGRRDIIVGAPGESYTATVSGIPSSATVTAGKVYVFRGEDLSAAGNPSPLLSVYLNGSTYFSNGVVGLLSANVAVNALFGFSVAATEDMNGDGLGEVLVGAPGYAAAGVLPLLPVRTGAALVYYSNNLAGNTAVKLAEPAASLLGIPVITDGLLFGFSVDGAGDYNMDGKPDLVVGAPAGISLSPPTNLLGGSAYVYTGNGAGVNTAHYASFRATPSLINTTANLFGFSVRGVKDANGARNGNVIIGAPNGNVLSNIIGGLRLKTGTVNVFIKSSNAPDPSGEIPDQSFSSPRANSLLSVLGGQNLNVAALFGASVDNMADVNCDGINDIVVGEPLSTAVGIINSNAVGGAVHVFTGKADGTYDTHLFWELENNTDFPLGINAGSLLGYSVAGAGHVMGASKGTRMLIGAPGAAMDFSTGIFNLGSTFGTLFGFTAGNNGLGKSYQYGFDNCGLTMNPDINATWVNVMVNGNVTTNDLVPAGTSYGTPVPDAANAAGASISMNADGTYAFTSSVKGEFYYQVPVCIPGQMAACPATQLKITVLDAAIVLNPPVANTDIAITKGTAAVELITLSNDKCSRVGGNLDSASVVVIENPKNGVAVVNPVNGNIVYTANAGFTGKDTLRYRVCDNGTPSLCATAYQIITVNAPVSLNTTDAADDYVCTRQAVQVNGNVKLNDTDAEGDVQTVTIQTTTISGKGTLTLAADGSFGFLPDAAFTGPVDFPYTVCDNASNMACANATLHILVGTAGGTLPLLVTDFSVSPRACGILVQWSYHNQEAGDLTELEQSTDGHIFSTIKKIDSDGSTSGSRVISLEGEEGIVYYRLKVTDKSGKYYYSEVRSAKTNCAGNQRLQVMPSLLADNTRVVFTSSGPLGKGRLALTDIYGRMLVVRDMNVLQGTNQLTINCSSLPPGTYFIHIAGTDWRTETVKVVKH